MTEEQPDGPGRDSRPDVTGEHFVTALRSAAPYIHTHNGKTFVIAFPGEICLRADTDRLLADIALLSSLGVRIVLVHGVRPQIEAELGVRGIASRFVGDLRVTDAPTMDAVKAAVGSLRMDIEARLSASLGNTPMAQGMPVEQHGKITYAHLKSGALEISGSDWLHPTRQPQTGNMTGIYLTEGSLAELKPVFDRLREGADTTYLVDLREMPFGIYGHITDRFGEIRPAFVFLTALIIAPGLVLVWVDVERGSRAAKEAAGAVAGADFGVDLDRED